MAKADFVYDDYIAEFWTGDDEALVERWFTDDCVMISGAREMRGKAELLAFLKWAHDGVREVPRVQKTAREGDTLFAEVDMDFHATKPRPEFPFGALAPGDLVTVKFLVAYTLRGGKVAVLKSMTWPPGRGVTQLPRLGGHPSQVAAFHAYAAAFSNADFERFSRFYQPDVTLQLPSAPLIRGRDGVVAFYRPMFAKIREAVVVHDVQATDQAIRIDATNRFTAVEDAPDFVIGALKKGEAMEGRVFVDYALRDGLIASIAVIRQVAPTKLA
jgi:limonene-1,2-epoxide hydrolase